MFCFRPLTKKDTAAGKDFFEAITRKASGCVVLGRGRTSSFKDEIKSIRSSSQVYERAGLAMN